jgi:hypothetical protein
MAKKKSLKQLRFLESKGSPLSEEQKHKMEKEIRTGKVKITGKKKRKHE